MIISEVKHIIDILEKTSPKSFVFVLDTTDRSFIYRSSDRHDCSKEVISIDQEFGIDKITRGSIFYIHKVNDDLLFLKTLDKNSFLGVCMLKQFQDPDLIDKIKTILKK